MKSDQPKPATEQVKEYLKKWPPATTGASWYDDEMKQLRSQLAAEREKYARSQEKVREYFDLLADERKASIAVVGSKISEIRQLQEQLAALEQIHRDTCQGYNKLNEQLAAEREKREAISRWEAKAAGKVQLLRKELDAVKTERNDLKCQLAAERERTEAEQ